MVSLKNRKAYLEYLKHFYRNADPHADESGLMLLLEPGKRRKSAFSDWYIDHCLKMIRQFCTDWPQLRNKSETDPFYNRQYPLSIGEFLGKKK